MVLHDMNQAMRYSTEVIALTDGKNIAQGSPESVISEELLKKLYGVDLDIVEVNGKPFVYMA